MDDIEVEEGLEVGEELNLTPDPLPEVSNGWYWSHLTCCEKFCLGVEVIYELYVYQNNQRI